MTPGAFQVELPLSLACELKRPGACSGMVASATLGEAQILESGLMLADAAQACGFAAAWLLQALESDLILADAAQTWGLAAA